MSEALSKRLLRGAATFLTRSQNSNCLNYSRDSQGAAAPRACVAIFKVSCWQPKELRAKPVKRNEPFRCFMIKSTEPPSNPGDLTSPLQFPLV